MKRHICCKCGRKRLRKYLKSYYTNLIVREIQYTTEWKSYPQRNSFRCIEKCLSYKTGDVHFTEALKK